MTASVPPTGGTLRKFFRDYFGSAQSLTPQDFREALWNSSVTADCYAGNDEKYQGAILDQYKIYVEMADRVSARRSLANTFFLTLNTAALVFIGVFWQRRPEASPVLLVFPLVVLLGVCGAWFWIVRAYRQLNAGKYVVIGALEERLPASPYWAAEWHVLGGGRDKSRYWPLTHVEHWVPALFALAYLAGFAVAVGTS
jgi:hypothetical protein